MSTRLPRARPRPQARVSSREVLAAHPTYRALLLVARGLVGGPSDAASEGALVEAETGASATAQPDDGRRRRWRR